MDTDRVLVMATGTVEELGHPRELAAKIGSRVAALVAKSKEHAVGTNEVTVAMLASALLLLLPMETTRQQSRRVDMQRKKRC
jgi:ABC-type sugar transport system ATPase subunit